MAERTVEEEARRQVQIRLRESKILKELEEQQEQKYWAEFAKRCPAPARGGSRPWPWWLILLVLAALCLIAWAVSLQKWDEKIDSSPPPPPVVSSSSDEAWWARLGIDVNQEPAPPTDPYDESMGSYKPSHEGLGFYGEAAKRTMWDD